MNRLGRPVGRVGALHVGVVGEQRFDPLVLSVGEQVGVGVRGAPGPVERVAGVPAVPARVLLGASAAPVQRVTGQTHHMKWVMPTSA